MTYFLDCFVATRKDEKPLVFRLTAPEVPSSRVRKAWDAFRKTH